MPAAPPRRALVLFSLENLALSVVRSLGAAGYRVTAAGAGAGGLVRLSRHCRAYVRLADAAEDLAEPSETLLARLEHLARERGVELIVPADVPGALCAARLRARMTGVRFYPFSEPETLRTLDDKWAFHQMLERLGLPTPPTFLAETAGTLPYPVILKPRGGAGGEGIETLADAASLAARLRAAHGGLLVQERIPGREVSLSFMADRGRLLAWTVHVRRPDGAVEFIDEPRAVAFGRRIAEAAAYTGPCNVDLRSDDRDPSKLWIIECNPRFWGSFDHTLGLGVDFMGVGLALAEGRTPAAMTRTPTGVCEGFLATARRAARLSFGVTPESRAFLRRKLGDPAPELYKAALHALGGRIPGP